MKHTRAQSEAALPPEGGVSSVVRAPAAEPNEGVQATMAAEPALTAKEQAPKAEEEEDDGEEEDDDDDEEEVKEPPKLEDGFFEIEDIRKKRVRQGKLQYLIKWRGWPESASTWEPVENLESCTDIIEAFEERLGTPRSSRKRRRRHGGTQSVSKKKRPTRLPAVDDSDALELFMRQVKAKEESDRNCVDGKGREEDEGKEAGKETAVVIQEANGSLDEHSKENQKEADSLADQTRTNSPGYISINLPGPLVEEDGLSRVQLDGSPFKGAKKRKSGSVRRFKQDTRLCNQEGDQSVASVDGNGPCSRNEEADSTEDETGEKNKPNDSADPPSITKIIMPVRYFASVNNNLQEVAITFKALRSDGKEVLVDDKELKANNTLLLISYYEQHLRYTPHT